MRSSTSFHKPVLLQIQPFQSGETLNGSVTYYYDNPLQLSLYDEAGKKQVFEPEQIKEIKLNNGEKFVAKSFVVNKDSTSLILQSLIESPKISLYTREDGADLYFYVSKDNVLYRLENNNVVLEKGRKTYTRKDYKYIGTLSSLMADRVDLLQRMDKVKLLENDLTEVIVDYNKGAVTYYWKQDSEVAKNPNWVFFADYSQHGTFSGDVTDALSAGQGAGVQYYFSTHSRHSVKIGLGRTRYRFESRDEIIVGVSFKYEYAFKQSEKFNLYLNVHVADAGHATIDYRRENLEDYDAVAIVPRLSPGLGVELRPLSKVAVYGELNHIMRLNQIPRSFSFGIKYDFGKVSW